MRRSQSLIVFLTLLARAVTAEWHLRNRLQGKHLKAITGHFVPSVMVLRNSSDQVVGYAGLAFEVFDWLSHRLHFSYALEPAENNLLGVKVDGKWNGMIGKLSRKEVDVSLGPYTLDLKWYEAFECAGYVGGGGQTILVKYPKTGTSQTAVLEPFNPLLWLIWICFLSLVLISAFALLRVRKNLFEDHHPDKFDDFAVYLVGTITAQGSFYRVRTSTIGVMAAVGCIAAFVFVNVYSSTLTSFLSLHYRAPEFNSLEALARSSTYQLLMIKGSISEISVMKSSSGFMKVLAYKHSHCPECSILKLEDIGQRILNGNAVGFLPSAWASGLIQRNFNGKCKLTSAYDGYGYFHTFFGVPRGSQYIEELNRETLWAMAMGLNKKWRLDKIPPQCVLKYNNNGVAVEQDNQPLSVSQLSSAFIILIAGYLLSLVKLLIERRTARTLVPRAKPTPTNRNTHSMNPKP